MASENIKTDKSADEQQLLNNQLFEAIDKGDVEKVKQLIKDGADVNARLAASVDFLGRHHGTVVSVGRAVMGDAWGPAQQQSNKGSSFRLDKFGRVISSTPIMHAIRYGHKNYSAEKHGHIEIAKILIEKGADLNETASEKIFPLLLLSLDANADMVKLLLKNGAEIKNKNSDWDCSFYANHCRILESELYLEDKETSSFDLLHKAEEESEEYQEFQKKFCFVATMVYDDIECREIKIIRKWRDNILRRNIFGQFFIHYYYKKGKKIAILLSWFPVFVKIIKYFIDILVSKLSRINYS